MKYVITLFFIYTSYAKFILFHTNNNDKNDDRNGPKERAMGLVYTTALEDFLVKIRDNNLYKKAIDFAYTAAHRGLGNQFLMDLMYVNAKAILGCYKLYINDGNLTERSQLNMLQKLRRGLVLINEQNDEIKPTNYNDYKDTDAFARFLSMMFDDILIGKLKLKETDNCKTVDKLRKSNLEAIAKITGNDHMLKLFESIKKEHDVLGCSLNFLDVIEENSQCEKFTEFYKKNIKEGSTIIYELTDSQILNAINQKRSEDKQIRITDTDILTNLDFLTDRVAKTKLFKFKENHKLLQKNDLIILRPPLSELFEYHIRVVGSKGKYTNFLEFIRYNENKKEVHALFKKLTFDIFG